MYRIKMNRNEFADVKNFNLLYSSVGRVLMIASTFGIKVQRLHEE
jgi:hypothetical protein